MAYILVSWDSFLASSRFREGSYHTAGLYSQKQRYRAGTKSTCRLCSERTGVTCFSTVSKIWGNNENIWSQRIPWALLQGNFPLPLIKCSGSILICRQVVSLDFQKCTFHWLSTPIKKKHLINTKGIFSQ